MRTTLNISMPTSLKKFVDKAVSEGNYASTSEFFRDTIRSWQEDQLYKSVLQSEKEFIKGKGMVLNSLADLD